MSEVELLRLGDFLKIMMLKDKKIILGITGGIAAYKACDILRRLKRLGAEVVVVVTENAKKFITPLTLETLSENEVVTEMFPERRFVGIRHVDLAGWADLILIAPATANVIGKIRSGIADDMLTTIVISSKAPVLIAPAMNVNMYENPIFQENLSYLEKLGYKFVEPEVGELASGVVGKGRLAEPKTIVNEAVKLLTRERDLEGKSIVVTASRTEEPLDPIRYLANRSSGKMGYAIACEAFQRGAKATLISGPSNLPIPSGLNFIQVKTAKDMLAAVRTAFRKADVLIMAAAVSDFSVSVISKDKIKKGEKEILVELKPTVDILKEMGRKKSAGSMGKEKILVGFSLETEDEIKNAKKKIVEKNLDLIVVNNPNISGAGFEVDTNQVTLIDKRGRTEKLPLLSKKEVATKILDKVKLLLRKKR